MSKLVETNVRFGVVNVRKRTAFEKKFHTPYEYYHIGFNKEKAISICRKKKSSDYIVERIWDTLVANNNREEIFRGGKEYEEKDN